MEKEMFRLKKIIADLEERLSDLENKNWRSEEKIKELETRVDWLEGLTAEIEM